MNQIKQFEKEFSLLNPEQKKAVESMYGPLMVVAGPGTGKTQIIAMRTANIILKTDVDPFNILITTFTEAGVHAIKERLLRFIGTDAYKVNVATIHTFSNDVIKFFPEKFIRYKASREIDDIEQLEILKILTDELVEKKKIEHLTSDYDRYYFLRTIKERISKLKQEGITINKFESAIKDQQEIYVTELAEIKPTLKKYETTINKQEKHILKLKELQIFMQAYDDYLRKNEFYDFNDMINFVLQVLREDEELRTYLSERYQFIMIDEYQDTNNAQNEIMNLIISMDLESPNIMVVGDDDQSIYRFQGANLENMLDFTTKYPETNILVLDKNYRSHQQILDVSLQSISKNNERLVNKIPSLTKQIKQSNNNITSSKPILLSANNDVEEKYFVYLEIEKLISAGISPSEIAILLRSNREVEEWTQFLQANEIEVDSKLKANILRSPYIEFILDYLKIILDPYSDEHVFLNLLRNELVPVNKLDVLKINKKIYDLNYSRKQKLKLMDILTHDSSLNALNLTDKDSIVHFAKSLLTLSSFLAGNSFIEFFNNFIRETNLLDAIEKSGSFDDVEDVFTIFSFIKDLNLKSRGMTLEQFLNKIDLYKKYKYAINRQILKKSNEGVQIMTVHASKGLEYNTVFLPGLVVGSWGGKKHRDNLKLPLSIIGEGLTTSEHDPIEEERRLFFVALTRAKEKLFLTFPKAQNNKALIRSEFLLEIEEEGKFEVVSEINMDSFESVTVNSINNRSLISHDESILSYVEKFLENYKLSPSDLNVFLEDPREFMNRAILKYPFIDNEYTIFGKVYHRTLELFFGSYKKTGQLLDSKYLVSTFKNLLSKEILTPEQEEKLLKKGIDGLEGFYKHNKSSFAIPLRLEFNFRHRGIVFEGVPLTGKIDKVDVIGGISDNSNSSQPQTTLFGREQLALVDYKTGKIRSLNDIMGKTASSKGNYYRQLLFYKLMCECDNELSGHYDVGSLRLDFVEGRDEKYECVDVPFEEEAYDELKKNIKDAWGKISDIEYWKEFLNDGNGK